MDLPWWKHHGASVLLLWGYGVLWTLMLLLWDYGNFMVLPWCFHRSMLLSLCCHGSFMVTPWWFRGDSMVVP